MSTVDKRVVQMVFDNEDFEKNLAKSQKSLESIDKQMTQLGEGLNENKLANAVTRGMDAATDSVEIKGEIIRGIMQRIGNSIADMFMGVIQNAQRAINSLTFDQINAGFSKYEEKLANVQTLMNATGETIEFVESRLQDLNWYTDETSANFNDMANNIGKFVSAGVDLDTASEAMMGISNWAYLSGANLQQASRAMYNFSQAMGTGYMSLQDWKSIEFANMATLEFKQTVIETAREMYKSGKLTNDVITEYGITAENFNADLKKKWFSADIMTEVTKAYGSYSTYIMEIQKKTTDAIADDVKQLYETINGEEIDFDTASRTMEYLNFVEKQYKDDIKEIIKTNGENSKELEAFVTRLGISTEQAIAMTKSTVLQDGSVVEGYFYDISKKAFLAAQEYKTFADVISATADAVSTKWMNVFQQLFGNYEEAKALWSEFGDIFYTIFAEPVDNILEIIKVWNQFSGRGILLGIAEEGEKVNSVLQLLEENTKDAIKAIEKAFFDVFPFLESTEALGKQLAVATYQLREFIRASALSEDQLNKLRQAATGVFKILKGITKILYSIGRSALVIIEAIFPSVDSILALFGIVNEHADDVEGTMTNLANTIWRVANVIAAIIKGFKQAVMDGSVRKYLTELGKYLLAYAAFYIYKFVDNVKKAFSGIDVEFTGLGGKIAETAGKIGNTIYTIARSIIDGLGKAVTDFMESGVVNAFTSFLNQVPSSLGGIFTNLFNIFKNLLIIIENILGAVNEFLTTLSQNKGAKAGATLASIVGLILIIVEAFLEGVKEGRARAMTEAMTELIEGIGKSFKSFQNLVNATALAQIATSILLVAVSAMILAKIPGQELKQTMFILTGTLVTLVGSLAIITSFSSSKVGTGGLAGILNSMQKLAIAVLVFSNVILKLMNKDTDEIEAGIHNLGQIFFFVGVFIAGLRLITKPLRGMTENQYNKQIASMISIIRNITWVSIAIAMLSGSFISMAKLNSGEMVSGIIGTLVIFAAMNTLMTRMRQMSVQANPANLAAMNKAILGVGAAILTFSISLSIFAAAVTIMTVVLGVLPTEMLTQGLFGMGTVLFFMSGFLAIMKLIVVGFGHGTMTPTAMVIMNKFATSLIGISGAFAILGVAIGLYTASIAVLGKLAQSGVLAEGMKAIVVIFALFASFTLIMRFIMFINVGFVVTGTEFALFLLGVAGAITILGIGLRILASSLEKIGQIDDIDYVKGMKKLSEMLATAAVIILVGKGVAWLVAKIPAATTTAGVHGGAQHLGLSMSSFAKEILMLGAGLSLIELSLSLLSVPIALFSSFKEHAFDAGVKRMWSVLWRVAAFLGILMFLYGATNGVAAAMGYKQGIGDMETTEETQNIQSLFNRKGNKVTKQMDGFGEAMYQMGKALVLVAAAITLLLVPVAVLGKMSERNNKVFKIGLFGVTLLLAAIAGLFVAMFPLMKYTSANNGTAARLWALVGIIGAIGLVVWALVSLVKDLGDYSNELTGANKIVSGMVSIFFILLFIVGSLAGLAAIQDKLVSSGTDLLAVGGAIVMVAGSVIAIAFALKMLGDAVSQTGDAITQAGVILAIGVILIGVITAILAHFGDNALKGAASFAMVILSIGGAFILLGAALMIIQSALDKLITTAERSQEGWDAIYKGVGVFLAFAIVCGVLIVLMAVFAGALPEVAIIVIGLAAAILSLALAFYLVVEALTVLADNWNKIEIMLDNVTTWLSEHSEEWAVILGKFFASALKVCVDTLIEMGGKVGELFKTMQEGSKEAAELGLTGLDAASYTLQKVGSWAYDYDKEHGKNGLLGTVFNGPMSGVWGAFAETPQELNSRMRDNAYGYAIRWAQENGLADAYGNVNYNDRYKVFTEYLNRTKALVDDLGTTEEEFDKFLARANIIGDPNMTGFGAMYSGASLLASDYAGFNTTYEEKKIEAESAKIYNDLNSAREKSMAAVYKKYGTEDGYILQGTVGNALNTYENMLKAYGYTMNDSDIEYFNKQMAGIVVNTDRIVNDVDTQNGMITDANSAMFDYYDDVSSGAGMFGEGTAIDENILDAAAQNGYGTQLSNEVASGTKQGIVDGLWTFFSNSGNGLKQFFTDVFGKEAVDKISEKLGKWGTSALGSLGTGIENLTGYSVNDLKDLAGSFLGYDVNSEEWKKAKEALSSGNIGNTIQSVVSGTLTDVKGGKDFKTALNNRLEQAGLGALGLNDNAIIDMISEASGLNLFEQGDYSALLSDLKMDELTEGIKEQINSTIGDATDGLFELGEDGGIDMTQGFQHGILDGSFDPNSILEKYGFNTDDAVALGNSFGMDYGTGLVDGYTDQIKNQSKDIMDVGKTMAASGLGSVYGGSKSSKMIKRFINGEELMAAATVADLNLVQAIGKSTNAMEREREMRAQQALKAFGIFNTIKNNRNTSLKLAGSVTGIMSDSMVGKTLNMSQSVIDTIQKGTYVNYIGLVRKAFNNTIPSKTIGMFAKTATAISKASDSVNTTATAINEAQKSKTTTKGKTAPVYNMTATSSKSAYTSTAYGTQVASQTGTSAASATQSAANAIDYLRAINTKTEQIYTQLMYMGTQMDTATSYVMAIDGNVTEIANNPIPAVVDAKQAAGKMLPFINKGLGMAASMAARGV